MRRLLLLPLLLAVAAGLGVVLTGTAAAQGDDPLGYVVDLGELDDPDVIERGRAVYRTGCTSCHGDDGSGIQGPDIRGVGTASTHFYVTSGRMPQATATGQPVRKEPAYDAEEIEALVAYVDTLGGDGVGPRIPLVDPARGDLAEGGELFRRSCAACHQSAGAGGALSYGRNAPTLLPATPVQVAEVLRVGPGQMPVFGPDQLSGREVDSLVRYVQLLQQGDDPGGLTLGRIGPIPEGFVAIAVGLGATLLGALWIGKRRLQIEEDHDVTDG